MVKKKLEQLDDDMDVMLMMEFRQERWEEWEKFCEERGDETKVRG